MSGEWRRTWTDIPYIGGANGIGIDPPEGDGWQLRQSLHVPGGGQLGSMVHVWYRPGASRLDRAIGIVAGLRDQINAGENWSEQVIELRLKDVLDELRLARAELGEG
jgi:hypothetical protein